MKKHFFHEVLLGTLYLDPLTDMYENNKKETMDLKLFFAKLLTVAEQYSKDKRKG